MHFVCPPVRLISSCSAILLSGTAFAASASVDRAMIPMPAAPVAPAGAPNVLVVLLDDAGFGQSEPFGGLIPTPTLDRLAHQGLRYTRFHVTAMCSPTRAALLTGRNHHSVGMGTIANWPSPYLGYTTSIPKSAGFVSEVLRENGYATAAFGKWHLIPNPETTPAGPFDHWPTHQGFDHYYGFIGGETDQWHPEITEGTKPQEMEVPAGRKGDYTLNEALADHAISWIKSEKSAAPGRPFFIYYAPGATHAPLQAPKAWIDRFKGKFDMGWDRYREMVFARQKSLGVIPEDTVLTPRPPEIPAWDSLSADQRRLDARFMEIFAAFMAQSDHEIGRVVDAIQEVGELDNTMIVFIAGDNGASLEGGPTGTTNLIAGVNGMPESTEEMLRHFDQLGGPETTPFYPSGWGWAGNTPFQWGKRFASHLGGTRDPLVIFWPKRIHEGGALRTQYHHVIDLEPTILEATGISAPATLNGVVQQPIEGTSMVYTFDHPDAPEHRTTQYFEMLGNRSVYQDGWVASARSGQLPWSFGSKARLEDQPWALYDLSHDFSEAKDLATQFPEKTKALEAVFAHEAETHQVYPLNSGLDGRIDHVAEPNEGHSRYTYYAGTDHLYNATAPALENRSHTITAEIEVPATGAEGVLVAFGGAPCGFTLFVKDGKPTYTYNFVRHEITTVQAAKPLAAGHSVVQLQFAYDGGGLGKGATATLLVNGEKVGTVRIPHTVPVEFSYDETMDIGRDCATPVGDYPSPFAFTGRLDRVEIAYGLPQLSDQDKAALGKAHERAEAIKE